MTDLELAYKVRDAADIQCLRIGVDDEGRVTGFDLLVNNKEEIAVRSDSGFLQLDEL